MPVPSDFLPALGKYGDIAYQYLLKHLSEDQISEYIVHLRTTSATHGEAYRYITKEHGHQDTVFYALESMTRINDLYEAAQYPSIEPIDPEQAFTAAVLALRAGMLIGAVVGDDGKDAIIALAEYGRRFAVNVGKRVDAFTHYLVSLFQNYYNSHGRYPTNKEVVGELEKLIRHGFINNVDDDGTVDWGQNGLTAIKALEKRLTRIRKNLPCR